MNLPGTIDAQQYPHLVQLAADMPYSTIPTKIPLGLKNILTFPSHR